MSFKLANYIMYLSAIVDGRFLLWYPGMNRLIIVYDFVKFHGSIAYFSYQKLTYMVYMKFKRIIKLENVKEENVKEENVHVFEISQAHHLTLYLIRTFFILMLKK